MGLTQKAQDFRKLCEKGGQDGGSRGCIRTERGLRGDRLVVNYIGRSVMWKRDNSFYASKGRTRPRPLCIVLISHEIISNVDWFAYSSSSRRSNSMSALVTTAPSASHTVHIQEPLVE